MECMQRAVRIASGMAEAQSSLFATILNEYLYFYANGNEQVWFCWFFFCCVCKTNLFEGDGAVFECYFGARWNQAH